VPQEYERFIDAALDYYAATGGDAGPELAERPEDAPVNMFDDINPELLGGQWQQQQLLTTAALPALADCTNLQQAQ
jgi:hypothetical protein